MPSPNKGEKKEEFISRCMGSDEANKSFPDEKQRAAFCYAEFGKAHPKSDEPKKEASTNIKQRLMNGKWAINSSAFNCLYNDVLSTDKLTYGGLKGLLFGNPLKMKALDNDSNDAYEQETGDIGLLNISGILVKGPSEEDEKLLSLTNIDRISYALDTLANDPTVNCIVLNWNSPGGETTGIAELGRKIKAIDSIKPIYSWCENQCSSAAYWLASQSRLIGMTYSANIGNIGVYLLVPNESKKYEKEGIEMQAISSGKYKLLGHDHKALTEEETAILQEGVSKQHQEFKDTIKANRPNINDHAMEGLAYEGQDAFELGLVDIVADNVEEFLQTILT